MSAERELLDQEWARLKQLKEEFDQEKKAFYQEKKEWEQNKKKNGGFSGAPAEEELTEFKVFVGNLNTASTEESIMPYFTPHGEIQEVYILKDHEGKSKRSAFIKFATKDGAEKAIAAVNGRVNDEGQDVPMVVKFARKKSDHLKAIGVGVMGAAPVVAAAAYRGSYGAQYGADPYGYAAPPQPVGVGSMYDPYAVHAPAPVPTTTRGPSGANLYVNHLDATLREEGNFRKLFSAYGKVMSSKVFPQGYGFISYDNIASAQAAIAGLNGMQSPDGIKRLEVKLKTPSSRGSVSGYESYGHAARFAAAPY